jgi:IrrE N-terminal-like domain
VALRPMLEDLNSYSDIVRLTDRLLRTADAYGRFPTPVEDILVAANLEEVSETFLSESSIATMPAHLRGVLRRVSGKVHAALDRKMRVVHLNPATDLVGQKAFKRLHETSHDLFPWQHIGEGRVGFADNEMTLSPRTTSLFEREANQGAAELLFQRDRFAQMAGDYAIGCAAVVELANLFGASRHATFRRYVESHPGTLAGVVLGALPCDREPLAFNRYEVMCSSSWTDRFTNPATWPTVLRSEDFSFVEQARACGAFGPPCGEWTHADRNQDVKMLKVEAMTNSYRNFVLVWLPRREIFKRRRTVAVAA